ncbi:MAG: PKD domain-containing protein, partial [Bacteroidia bacterium]
MNYRLSLTICFAVLLSIFSKTAYATHSMGADLTYTCLGGNNYKLRLSFYRDCSGIAAPSNVTINIHSISCGDSLNVVLLPIPGTGVEITPICTSVTSTCNGGTFTGIREWIYEGIVTLPSQCPDWGFSYNLCCRNGAISTIVNPLNEQIYIHSMLNNTISPCNNSPTFMNKPVPFVCAGQQFCYNHGAYDPDGDSLAYSLINPLGTGGVPVTYIPPYSATQPMNSVPAMTFNPLTGDFCATPQSIEVTVMAVLIQEYRNGVLIGEVERDMQITVTPCTNTIPNLSGINGTNNFSATICANQPFCFDIYSNDLDSGQNLTVTWDQSINGGVLNSVGSPHPVSTFCWTPTSTDVSSTPHCFTVRVQDNACPYLGSQIYSFCLTVVNVTANAGPNQTVNCGGTATITATGSTTTGSYTYLWSNGITAASQNVSPGTYTVTVSNGFCTATDVVKILLNSGISAAFNNTNSCINSPVSFTNASVATIGAIAGYKWSFGDGSTSTLQNPFHVYASANTYNVCLKVSSTLGCNDSICKNITVQSPPSADFTVNNDCEGKALNLTNTSTPANLNSYSWNFGNGTTSTLQSPVLSFPNAGTYNVNLIVIDSLGCTDTVQYPVISFPLPVAAFTITGGGLCAGGLVSLIDNSTGIINNWSWTFGNGLSSTLQNPSLTYVASGPYNITLLVTSNKGCVDSVTLPVTISMPFIANAIAGQSICPGNSASLTASGGASYLWSSGQTTSSISVSPSANSTYTVTVTDSRGCSDTSQAVVTIFPLPQVTTSPSQAICIGQSTTLNASGASTYSWLPGGVGQSINVSPTANTNYIVTGTDVNGCVDTAMVNIVVNVLPVVNLTNPVICPSSSVTLNAGNPGAGYQWSTGITSQSITTSTAGSYSVTVTNSFGCTATGQSTVGMSTLIPNVQSLSMCKGAATTLNAANAGCTYFWSTGATTQNISVNTTATYTVTVSDVNGCSISFSSTLVVNPLPVVNFIKGTGCLNDSTTFTNTSSVSSGTISSYVWKFGDGSASQQQNPHHKYATAGVYNVCLLATTNNGCIDSICKSITINTPPTANFTVNNDCQGKALNLVNTSTPSGLSLYSWNFGNGSTSTSTSPTLSYSSAGNYSINLTVYDANGCSDTVQNQVTVFPLPQVTASPNQSICKGQTATLTVTGASTYLWSPGGATGQSINVTPMSSSYYLVVGTDGNGCVDTSMVNIAVNQLPVVNLTNPVICPSSSVTLNAGNPGAGYQWSTGITSQSITTSTAGSYSVTVTNSFGCTATGQSTVGMSTLIPNVQSLSICQGTSTTLNAANAGSTYLWSTGTTTQNISVNTTGTYTVTVSDVNGCSISFSSTLVVNPLPVVNFIKGTGCLNDSTTFSNTSSVSSGTISSYVWKFGDGSASQQQN